MNEISKITSATMSSLEISMLTCKDHKHVLGDIRRILDEVGISSAPFEAVYKDQQLIGRPCFKLPRRECDLIIAGYSAKYRLAIIDRWHELEAKQAPALPNYQEALRQLADSIDLSSKQQLMIEAQKPAVEFVERYIESTGNKGFRDTCKLLNANEARFKEFLTEQKIMYRLDGKLMAYGCHIDAKRFEVSAGVADNEHAYTVAKFTPKGINWVAGLWAVQQLKLAL